MQGEGFAQGFDAGARIGLADRRPSYPHSTPRFNKMSFPSSPKPEAKTRVVRTSAASTKRVVSTSSSFKTLFGPE